MNVRAEKLTDLPVALLSHILSGLVPARWPSQSLTLEWAETEETHFSSLPQDLLDAAKASPALAEAVANVIAAGPCMLYQGTTFPLHEWIPVLAPFVKAVCSYAFFKSEFSRLEWNECGLDSLDGVGTGEGDYTIRLFDALSVEPVHLQVLGVSAPYFATCEEKDHLSVAIVRAIQQSAETLKELGVQLVGTSPLCPSALKKVCLPNLKVAQLSIQYIHNQRGQRLGRGNSANAFLQLLGALDGHADRSKKRTTLQELRLLDVEEVPCTSHVESCAGLFKAVKCLKLRTAKTYAQGGDSVTQFIALFSNLERLHLECSNWEMALGPNHFCWISDACENLKEIHLHYPAISSYLTPQTQQFKFDEVFRACHGKLRSLAIKTILTTEDIRILGETNPELENLDIVSGQRNIDALLLLLGSHCRKLQSLNLLYISQRDTMLGETFWRTLEVAVNSASKILCEVSIESHGPPLKESEVEAIEHCMTEIVKFLGDRARKISLMVPVALADGRAKVDLLCRLMQTCEDHATNLEDVRLSVDGVFGIDQYEFNNETFYRFGNEQESLEMWEQFLARKQRMISALPRLKNSFFGGLEDFSKERFTAMNR